MRERGYFQRKLDRLEAKDYKYEPLKLTFYFSSPVCLTHPWIHIDTVIGRLLLMEALGEDFFLLPTKQNLQLRLPSFPIKETSGLVHASVSIFDTEDYRLEMLYKRFEDRFANFNGKISRGSGYFKDFMIQHLYLPAREVSFYLCADAEEIDRLCRSVITLGDNTRIGWGAVKGYKIESTDKDYSIVKDGKAMREIPVSMLKSYSDVALLTWKAPYWHPDNLDLCAVPFSFVELSFSL